MVKLFFFLVILVVLSSCGSNKPYPHNTELHNHLNENAFYLHQHKKYEQLIKPMQNDSSKFAEIIALNESTEKISIYLENLKTDLVNTSGGMDENAFLINPNDVRHSQRLLFEEGRASDLKKQLNAYSKKLKKLGLNDSQIAFIPQNTAILKNDPNFNKLSFEEVHFKDATMIDCLKVIENYKLYILMSESLAINIFLLNNQQSPVSLK